MERAFVAHGKPKGQRTGHIEDDQQVCLNDLCRPIGTEPFGKLIQGFLRFDVGPKLFALAGPSIPTPARTPES